MSAVGKWRCGFWANGRHHSEIRRLLRAGEAGLCRKNRRITIMGWYLVTDRRARPRFGNANMTGIVGRTVSRHRTRKVAEKRAAKLADADVVWGTFGCRVGAWVWDPRKT